MDEKQIPVVETPVQEQPIVRTPQPQQEQPQNNAIVGKLEQRIDTLNKQVITLQELLAKTNQPTPVEKKDIKL